MEDTNIVNDVQDENETDEINEINNVADELERQKRQKTVRTCTLVAIALSVLSMLLRTLSLFFFYEKDIAYYKVGAALPIISNVVYATAVIFFTFSAFAFIKKAQESDGAKVAPPSFACRMASLLPAAALLYYAASSYLKYGNGEPSGLEILSVIFAVLGAIFFVLLSQKQKAPRVTAVFGLAPIAWVAFVWIESYIDYTVPLNSPDKLYFHFGCIALAFLVINEIRVLISCVRPREIYFSLAFALLALATSAIPSIIADSQGVFSRYPSADADVVLLSVFIYALLRISDALPQLNAPAAKASEVGATDEIAKEDTEETIEENTEENVDKDSEEFSEE